MSSMNIMKGGMVVNRKANMMLPDIRMSSNHDSASSNMRVSTRFASTQPKERQAQVLSSQ